jgi:mono/diheme cytochrome c family protein
LTLTTPRRTITWLAVLAGVCLVAVTAVVYRGYLRNGPAVEFADAVEHFKYGSIGAEVDGLPYPIWKALPLVCPDMLPGGYASLGFITEPGRELPIGVTVRQYGLPRVGFNCATCHTASIDEVSAPLLGAPAERLDLGAYTRFILACGTSDRFTPGIVLDAMPRAGVHLGLFDRLMYRVAVVPRARSAFRERVANFAWSKSRPSPGPGRTDALNPWRQRHGLNPSGDSAVATVDFPSIWKQEQRERFWLHWDANNNSLAERNLSAALAGGASESSLDLASIERVGAWLRSLPSPAYPFPIDAALAQRGRAVYEGARCAACHDVGGVRTGEATPLAEIGTDPERLTTLSADLLRRMLEVGTGYPWRFTHYRQPTGYANNTLDGIWARAPYLHNGAVPTLWDLLLPPEHRPPLFGRGCGRLEPRKVGFDCDGPFVFHVDQKGNGNGGHLYGTMLAETDRRALVEYLKSL